MRACEIGPLELVYLNHQQIVDSRANLFAFFDRVGEIAQLLGTKEQSRLGGVNQRKQDRRIGSTIGFVDRYSPRWISRRPRRAVGSIRRWAVCINEPARAENYSGYFFACHGFTFFVGRNVTATTDWNASGYTL